MTPKEQELWQAFFDTFPDEMDNFRAEMADRLLAKARDCYAEELQAERMVTFKLSQQIEKKDVALREALEYSGGELPDLVVEQIKEALK